MIPAIGPESGVFCVLAVFTLAAGGHGRPRQSHREATGGHGKATGSGGQSQIPYVFPFGRPREATAKPPAPAAKVKFLMFFPLGGHGRPRQSHGRPQP